MKKDLQDYKQDLEKLQGPSLMNPIKTILDVLQTCGGFINIIYQNQSMINPKKEREIQFLTIICYRLIR